MLRPHSIKSGKDKQPREHCPRCGFFFNHIPPEGYEVLCGDCGLPCSAKTMIRSYDTQGIVWRRGDGEVFLRVCDLSVGPVDRLVVTLILQQQSYGYWLRMTDQDLLDTFHRSIKLTRLKTIIKELEKDGLLFTKKADSPPKRFVRTLTRNEMIEWEGRNRD